MNRKLRNNCDKENSLLRRGLNKEPKFTRRAAFYKLARAREFCRNLEMLRFKPGSANKRCQTDEQVHQPHSRVQCVGNVFSINSESRGEKDTLCGLPHLFSPDLLVELIAEDKELSALKSAAENRDFAAFRAVGKQFQQFYSVTYVTTSGILVVDNRIAVPSSLRQAVLAHVHRAHLGHQAMID